MKTAFVSACLAGLWFTALPALADAPATPPMAGIRFAGGDGSSVEKAVVILGATESTGIRAEYLWLDAHFPEWKGRDQSLLNQGKRVYDVMNFTMPPTEAYEDRLLPVRKSITTHIEFDSETERQFASVLDTRDDISLFVKLPRWFTVPTPAGNYLPDWGIVKQENDITKVYLVRETKSVWNMFELRATEKAKINCARKHFQAIQADFGVVTGAGEV